MDVSAEKRAALAAYNIEVEQKPERLPWRKVLTSRLEHETITAYVFGPLVKYECHTVGRIAPTVRFLDPTGKCHQSEAALIAKMNRLAQK